MTEPGAIVPSVVMVQSVPVDVEGSFETFYRDVEPRLTRALIAACGPVVGRDAAAAALAYGFEHWERVQRLANPAGYLYRVGRNAARRSSRRPDPAIDGTVAAQWGFEPGLPRALAALTEQQRCAVLLVHAWGLPLVEAAELLGVSVSSLRNHLRRGLAKLRSNLGVDDP